MFIRQKHGDIHLDIFSKATIKATQMNHLLETLKVYLVVLPPEPVSVPLLVLRVPALSPLHQHRVRGLQLLQHRRARRHHRGDHHAHAASVLHFHLALC